MIFSKGIIQIFLVPIAYGITCIPDFYDPKYLLCEQIPLSFEGWDTLNFCDGDSGHPTKLKLHLDISEHDTFSDEVSQTISEIINESLKRQEFCLGNVTDLTLVNFRRGFSNALVNGTTLQKVALSGTHLEQLPCDLFENSVIEQFHIKKSNIKEINKCVFRDSFTNFTGFSLDQSDCDRLSHNTFEYAPNLESLSLSENNIAEVDMQILRNLEKLRVLDLSNNGITHFTDKFFKFNTELSKLVLNDNLISELPCGIFQQNIKLKHLNLTRNSLSKMPCDIIERQGLFMTEFDLSENYSLHKKFSKNYAGPRGAIFKFFKKAVGAAAGGKLEQQISEICQQCDKKLGPRKKFILKNNAQESVDDAMNIIANDHESTLISMKRK